MPTNMKHLIHLNSWLLEKFCAIMSRALHQNGLPHIVWSQNQLVVGVVGLHHCGHKAPLGFHRVVGLLLHQCACGAPKPSRERANV